MRDTAGINRTEHGLDYLDPTFAARVISGITQITRIPCGNHVRKSCVIQFSDGKRFLNIIYRRYYVIMLLRLSNP